MSTPAPGRQLRIFASVEARPLLSAYSFIAVAAAAYLFIMYRAAVLIDDSRNGINARSYFVTHFIALVFEVTLWAVLAAAALRLKTYSRSVIADRDGRALDLVATGLLLSLLYAILFSVASTVKTLFMHTTHLRTVTTVTNLLPLAVLIVATILLYLGSHRLSRVAVAKPNSLSPAALMTAVAAYVALVTGYILYFYHTAPRLKDDDGLHHFVIGAAPLLAVYALPYALVWAVGTLAGLNIAHYANHVAGKIYRPLFSNVYKGLVLSLAGTYLAQIFYVSNLSSNYFGLGLAVALCTLSVIIYGCYLIYRGTNALCRLEK